MRGVEIHYFVSVRIHGFKNSRRSKEEHARETQRSSQPADPLWDQAVELRGEEFVLSGFDAVGHSHDDLVVDDPVQFADLVAQGSDNFVFAHGGDKVIF